MDRFQAISAFVKVVETGSFARAAERLDVSVSSVSRQVAELEAHLDARLLNRTTRRLSLTESGRAFHERCVQLLADLEEAEQSANVGTIEPRGTLRLTAAVTFGARHLAPALAEFVARHPAMRFDIELSDRATDLVEEGFDVAVRIGEIGSQNLVGRRVGATRLVCCAAPSYLERHGTPRDPGGPRARTHASPTSTRRSATSGRSATAKGASATSGSRARFTPTTGASWKRWRSRAWASRSSPTSSWARTCAPGGSCQLLRGFAPPPTSIHVVYPSRRHLSAKVRVFADFLAARFADAEWVLPRTRGA